MTSLPKTYKAVVLTGPNSGFKLQDVELQHPSKGQVLIKVLACGICYTDVDIGKGNFGNVFPRTPGHEIIGDVVELGEDVEGIEIGQRVGGTWHGGHDGRCRSCQRGSFQTCDNAQVNGVSKDGGYAEYALLRSEAVVNVPRDMDPADAAPLLCAGVTVFNGIRKMNIEQGNIVAIQGLGGLGHLAVQYAHNMGYEVAVLSTGDDKADFAKKLGATHYINSKAKDAAEELNKLGGAALIVQTAPNPAVVGPLVKGLQPHGKLLSLSPVGGVEFDTVTLIMKGASVHGWPAGNARDCEEAIRFSQTHGVKCMIEKYPLSDVQKAVDDLVAGKPRFRNVLIME
ncbi:Alcohol dehydrogenase-like protein [Paramyrothecium foliicola]|nr:Alcohol dehydrogenase-like protein [Paramyrothecium foliicola]